MPRIRRAIPSDGAACARICLLTGRYGADGTPDFPNDPDALARIYVFPYLQLEPDLALVLESDGGDVVGYCLAALDSAAFYARYDAGLRPEWVALFPRGGPEPPGGFSPRERRVHAAYHDPDYTVPGGDAYPSHLHIDLLEEARRGGWGTKLVRLQLAQLARRGSRGVHLGMAASNAAAGKFYARLGFAEVMRAGEGEDETVYLGLKLDPLPAVGPPPVPGETNVASYAAGRGASMAIGDAALGSSWVAVTQPDPWHAAAHRLGGHPPLAVILVASVHEDDLEAQLALLPAETEVVAGIGGGTAVDAAKYFSWRRSLRLVTIPTALTVDAFVTPPAGIRRGPDRRVEYLGHATPDPLVIDFDLLRTAPPELNIAGAGDILSIHTACFDWELAHAAGRTDAHPFSPSDCAAARSILGRLLASAADIRENSDAGLSLLAESYMRINALCLPAGHARCEEGSEHYLFYELEARLGRGFVHGRIVGLGVYLMSLLQGNGAGEIRRAMGEMGLEWQPRGMGISRWVLRASLLDLKRFVAGREDLWYTVVDGAEITEGWVDAALADLEFAEEGERAP